MIDTSFSKVLSLLESIQNFPKTKSRKNISSNLVNMFCLGDVPYRGQHYLGGKIRGPSKYNQKFPELLNELNRLISNYDPNFEYTTIQITKNVASPPHIDKCNVGESYIFGCGDYQGGNLIIEGIPNNIHCRFLKFDGKKGHWTGSFTGTRYSIIFFTHTFKPPSVRFRNYVITKDGEYQKNVLIKSYQSLHQY